MKTKLKYEVDKEEKYNVDKKRYVNKIQYRGFGITITGNENEVNKAIDFFDEMLIKEGFELAKCPTVEKLENGNIEYYDYISIEEIEQKEEIKEIYKEFKKKLRRLSLDT